MKKTCLSIMTLFGVSVLVIACGTGPVETTKVTPAPSSMVSVSEKKTPDLIAPRTIKFESADKTEIVGTIYDSPNPDSAAVLLLHQWQSDRNSFDDFAKLLQAKGFVVLAIDGRGFGESVKTTDGRTVGPERSDEAVNRMLADVGNAYDLLGKEKNVDSKRIGIVGASYGSSLAIIYSAANENVKAVALLSPGLNYFGTMQTEPAAKSYGGRALLLVAAIDDAESADAVKKLDIAAGPTEKHEFKIYGKGGHGTNIFAAKVGLGDLLESFLTKSLKKQE